jgi:hypothetical protein
VDDQCTDPGVICAHPPPAPPAPFTTITVSHDYAMHALYLGDVDRSGVSDPNAWQTLGFDLDGLVTGADSTDVCTLAAGAPFTNQVDGNRGIDNSWGSNILPYLTAILGSGFSASIDANLDRGQFTDLLVVRGFDDTAPVTARALSGVLLGGGLFEQDAGGPAWDPSSHWPILPELLVGCPNGVCPPGTDPVASAAIQFPQAYENGGVFVSGPIAAAVPLPLSGASPWTLTIHGAIVTFQQQAPGSVTGGTVAGVLVPSEVIQSLQSVAGSLSTSLCAASSLQSIERVVQEAADIVVDPTSGEVGNGPGVACNGISIGVGFDASEVAAPTSADITGPTPPPVNACGDGG